MKSIKEKSEEYGEANLTNWGVVSTERVEGFETGANYVINEIEKCIKSSSNSRLKIDTIKQIIEQLKK